MEILNGFRRNAVFPSRLDLDAVMKGPKFLGRDRGWFMSSNSQNSRNKFEMTEALRKFNDTLSQRRRQRSPVPALESGSRKSVYDRQQSSEENSNQKPIEPSKIGLLLRRFTKRANSAKVGNEEAKPGVMTYFSRKSDEKDGQSATNRSTLDMIKWWDYEKCTIVFDPEGAFYLTWLFIVSLCFSYNAWGMPLRACFPYQTPENTPIWLIVDAICDIFYWIDTIVIKPRITYLKDGFFERNPLLTKKHYHKTTQFKMDLIAMFPFEILYFYFGTSAVLLRLGRYLKIQTFLNFYASLDRIFKNPYIVRIGRSVSYMIFMIHICTCAYYKMSTFEGIGSNGWVYNGNGNPYYKCFYFATKVATSIGKNPKPENEIEYVFMTISWMMGVFVFALMIGQVKDIIATATRVESEYRKLVDDTKEYMNHLSLEAEFQNKITSWFDFTWGEQRSLDENQSLNVLPINLKTDVAINVHIQTLNKVQLFNDCDEALLRDLVLKLKPVIYLPGDLVCRKGDVGRQMYIIKMGKVQVMGGEDNQKVLATLLEGSVFGEISLLAIGGLNRRTADVKSHGYSNLFVLDKEDLNSALQYYPEARDLLNRKARILIRKNAGKEGEEDTEEDSCSSSSESSSASEAGSSISTNSGEETDYDSSYSSIGNLNEDNIGSSDDADNSPDNSQRKNSGKSTTSK